MKTIGLLGGMSWESTVPYYQTINRIVMRERGGLHSARLVLYSVDFQDMVDRVNAGRWDTAAATLADAARSLRLAGAEFLVMCVNTLHKVADEVERDSGLPILHIADVTALRIRGQELRTIGLLGTQFVMEEDFYTRRLDSRHGIRSLIPGDDDRAFIHRIIYEELAKGVLNPDSRARCRRIMSDLVARGAEGIVLACTELPLLLGPEDCAVSLFPTSLIHAEEAAFAALRE